MFVCFRYFIFMSLTQYFAWYKEEWTKIKYLHGKHTGLCRWVYNADFIFIITVHWFFKRLYTTRYTLLEMKLHNPYSSSPQGKAFLSSNHHQTHSSTCKPWVRVYIWSSSVPQDDSVTDGHHTAGLQDQDDKKTKPTRYRQHIYSLYKWTHVDYSKFQF